MPHTFAFHFATFAISHAVQQEHDDDKVPRSRVQRRNRDCSEPVAKPRVQKKHNKSKTKKKDPIRRRLPKLSIFDRPQRHRVLPRRLDKDVVVSGSDLALSYSTTEWEELQEQEEMEMSSRVPVPTDDKVATSKRKHHDRVAKRFGRRERKKMMGIGQRRTKKMERREMEKPLTFEECKAEFVDKDEMLASRVHQASHDNGVHVDAKSGRKRLGKDECETLLRVLDAGLLVAVAARDAIQAARESLQAAREALYA